MFGERLFMLSVHARSGPAQLVSEFVATFGLVSVIGDVRGAGPTPFHLLWPRTSPLRIGSRRQRRLRTRPSRSPAH